MVHGSDWRRAGFKDPAVLGTTLVAQAHSSTHRFLVQSLCPAITSSGLLVLTFASCRLVKLTDGVQVGDKSLDDTLLLARGQLTT